MRNIRFGGIAGATVALSVFLVAGPAAPAQDTGAAGTSAAARPEPPSLLPFIHADFCAAIVIHPNRIMNSPVMKQVPLEMLSSMAGPVATGGLVAPGSPGPNAEMVKLLPKIRRVTVLLAPAPGEKVPVEAAGIIQVQQAADVDEFISGMLKDNKDAKPTEVQGIKCWVDAKDGVVLCPAGGRIVVFAKEPTLKKMLAANSGDRPLVTQLSGSRLDHDMLIEVLVDPIFAAATKVTGKSPADVIKDAKGMEQFATLVTETKSVSLVVDLTGDTLARLAITASSEDSASKLLGVLTMGQSIYETKKKDAANNLPPGVPPQAAKIATDLADELMKGLKVSKEGNIAVVSVAMPKNLEQLPDKIMKALMPAGPTLAPPGGPNAQPAPSPGPDSPPRPGKRPLKTDAPPKTSE